MTLAKATEQSDPDHMSGSTIVESRSYPGIQALRAVAAISVVLNHVLATYGIFAYSGATLDNVASGCTVGVDLFFVISGFVIFNSTFTARSQPPSVLHFVRLRLTRIYPIYWIAIACIMGIHAFGYQQDLDASVGNIIAATLLLPREEPMLFTSWTLTYELFFYGLFACTLVLRKPLWSVLLTTAGIGCAIWSGDHMNDDSNLSEFLQYPIMWEFVFGMVLGLMVRHMRPLRLPPVILLAPLTLFILSVPWWLSHDPTVAPEPREWVWGLPCLIVVAISLRATDTHNLVQRIAVLLGNASYAIYLFHPLVLIMFGRVMRTSLVPRWSWEILAALAFLGSLALGAVVHLIIERPLLGLVGNRMWRKPSAPPGIA